MDINFRVQWFRICEGCQGLGGWGTVPLVLSRRFRFGFGLRVSGL